ncbi:organic cation transporter-like protein, partial [Trichonephila clavata]
YKFFNQSNIYKGEIENNNVTNKEIETCDSWEYDHSFYASTVVTEWNLVCDKEWLISMSKSIFVVGNIISATLLSYFADKFGRKPIILICSILSIVSAITCAFASSFIMFAVARLFIAVGVTGADIIAFVLLMEIIGPERRAFYGIGVNFGWISGYFIPPGIAWLLRDWFWMQIVLTMPCIILLLLWWLLPESPRWLLSHRKKEAALKVLSRAAKMNGFHCPKLDAKLEEIISKTNKVQS